MRRWFLIPCLAALALAGALREGRAAGESTARVAVAANFAAPFQAVAEAFERESGRRLVGAVGSTGGLYAQIRNGAPFDAFLAADVATPERLEREGLAVAGESFVYARGRLVLWSREAGLVDSRGAILREAATWRIAIADPGLAPYGAAAMAAMEKLEVGEALSARLVTATSIGQAYQFAASGAARLGFVALSQVYRDGGLKEGSGWILPEDLHPPIEQKAALLARGSGNETARAFLAFLKGDRARKIIRSFGYEAG